MNSKIELIPSYEIAYIRKVGPYGFGNTEIMEQLKTWAKNNNLFNDDAIILGIAQDNPNIVKSEECRYDTCLVISNDYGIADDDIRQGNIMGGKYVVFKVNHTVEAVQKAWNDIFEQLIKQNDILDDTRPIIERYQFQMVKEHWCEICVPIH